MATGTGNLPYPGKSYTPFDILTAEELNEDVANIESLADGSGIGDGAIDTAALANDAVTYEKTDGTIWWEEIGRTTLASAGDTITVSSLPPRKYIMVIFSGIATGGTINAFLTFNNDTGANYATRVSSNGGADSTGASSNSAAIMSTLSSYIMSDGIIYNTASGPKFGTFHSSSNGSSGAGNAPERQERVVKWANTSDQITRVDCTNNTGTGDFAIGSELIILGHD